jgi:hypothetical protein
VHHAYLAPGAYTLRLLVRAGRASPRVISKRLHVGPQAAIANPYGRALAGAANPVAVAVAKGLPPHNPAVRLPAPVAGARDRVGTEARARRVRAPTAMPARPAGSSPLPWALGAAGALVLLAIIALAWRRASRARQGRQTG